MASDATTTPTPTEPPTPPTPTEPPPPLELDATPPEVKRYQRLKVMITATAVGLSIGALAFLGFVVGPELSRETNEWPDWQRLLVSSMLIAVTIELLTLPLEFYSGFVLEHRYELSNQSLAGWMWQRLKGYFVMAPTGLSAVFGLYWFIWVTGPWWWLAATAGWLVMTLILGRLLPVVIVPIFYKVTPLKDPALTERLKKLTEGTTLTIQGVYQIKLSTETNKANAALAGLGKSRRVLIGDTLLQQFTAEELEVVFAHEIGHHVHGHLPKVIAFSTVLSLAGFGLAHLVLTASAAELGYRGLASADGLDPTALPLLVFILAVFGLILTPLRNAVSRAFERQCDRYALERTQNKPAYRSAFIKLATINMVDPDPHPLVAFLFHDHPPIRERLAMADDVT
jgi:STE24 endopeptidase